MFLHSNPSLTSVNRALLRCTALVSFGLIALPAGAANIDWTNASGDGNWFNPANWSTGTVPTVADLVFIRNPATAGLPVVIGAPGATADEIEVDLSNQLVIRGPGTVVVGDIYHSGTIASPANTLNRLTIEGGGTASFDRFFLGDTFAGVWDDQAIVTGAGSTLNVDGGGPFDGFVVGTSGRGLLVIEDGGTVNVGPGGGGVVNVGLFATSVSTLQIGSGGLAGRLNATEVNLVQPTSRIFFNYNHFDTFDAKISGAGSITKAGTGTTRLTSLTTDLTGFVFVDNGTLEVNGTVATAAGVRVALGATVGGTGTLATTDLDGGTLAPGNSVGTITVAGNLTFGAGSTYAVEVEGATADRTNVTGTANLSGGAVAVSFIGGNIGNATHTILNAAGGLGGTTFTGVGDNSLFFDTSLTYDANNAFLNVTFNPNPIAGLTQNQAAVAGAAQGFFAANGFMPASFASLDAAGLNQVSGEIATAAMSAGFDAANQFLAAISDPFVTNAGTANMATGAAEPVAYTSEPAPLSSRVALAALGGEDIVASDAANAALKMSGAHSADAVDMAFDARWKLWGTVYGASLQIDGDPAVVGSADLRSTNWGVATGFSRDWGDGAGGLALGGAGSTFDLSGGLGSGNAGIFNAGLYAGQNFGNAYLSGALAYGWHSVRTTRAVPGDILTGRFNAHSFSGRLEAGYRVDTSMATLTPYAALQATNYRLPAYTETSAAGGGFAVAHPSQSELSARTELGLRAERVIPTASAAIKLSGRVAWAYNAANDRSVVGAFAALPGQTFTITGARPDRHAALVDVGIEAAFASGLAAKLSVAGEFSGNVTAFGAAAKISYRW